MLSEGRRIDGGRDTKTPARPYQGACLVSTHRMEIGVVWPQSHLRLAASCMPPMRASPGPPPTPLKLTGTKTSGSGTRAHDNAGRGLPIPPLMPSNRTQLGWGSWTHGAMELWPG